MWHQDALWEESKHCCRPCTPFYRNVIPWWLWPLSVGYCAVPLSKNGSGMVWGAQQQVWGVDLASKFPGSQSSRASVGCAGQQVPSTQLTGPKWSAANILSPDTTAHLQESSGVHAMMGQVCFGSKRGTHTILGRWSWCYACSVYIHVGSHCFF